MHGLAKFFLCASLFACETDVNNTQPDAMGDAGADAFVNVIDDAKAPDASTPSAWIVVAADFATGTGCGDDLGNRGCDIFRAKVSLPTFDLLTLDRITPGDAPHSFPTVSKTGDRIYFRTGDGSTDRSVYGWVNGTLTPSLLSKASYPALFPDSLSFIYVDDGNNLARAWLSSDGTKVDRTDTYGRTPPRGDPDVSPDGNFVLFNETGGGGGSGSGTSQARVLNLSSSAVADVSAKDGSGHCVFSASGKLAVCDSRSSGGLRAWDWDGTKASNERSFIADPSLTDVGDDYRSCRTRSVNYPAFCGDDAHVLVVVSCTTTLDGGESGSGFSKLFLVDLSSGVPKYRALSDEWSSRGGGKGTRAWTPACRPATP